MDPLALLQRRERIIALVRLLVALFALAQIAFYSPSLPSFVERAATVRSYGLALVGVLVALSVVAMEAARRARDVTAFSRLGAGFLIADTGVVFGLLYLYAFDPQPNLWGMLAILPLEGALRFQLAGALGVWGAIVPGYIVREILRAEVHELPADVPSLAFRLGLVLIISLFAGFITRDLEVQRRRLEQLNRSSQALAGQLEPAEILQTLCRESVRCLDVVSSAVYVHDGHSFHPVASWPTDALPEIIAQDEGEQEDPVLTRGVDTQPVWLEPDDRHPRRLVVPLRWGDQSMAKALVIRPGHAPLTTFEVDVARSLAESAALALATTEVLAAEQRSNRRLRYLEALRTRFVATIAHDLRTPLTIFKGAASLLRDRRDEIPEEQINEMLSSVERQANRLGRLADDLIDAARLDSEKLSLELVSCDLEAILTTAVSDAEEDISVCVTGDVTLVADPARLERVVWNLVSNAEKYGQPPIQVCADREGDEVRIAVRDHGAGITPEQREHLFEDFAGSGNAASVGLGLAIVAQLVGAHGGRVSYEEADPGARFTIVLPAEGPSS